MKTAMVAAVSLVLALSSNARANGPAFDCAKADGEVETLICQDAALAALDLQLAATYTSASAKAGGDMAQQLRAEQRGWISGRNDCWKATQQTWITATWTVNTVRDCVDAQYRLRISELQALWQLLPPKTVSYACDGNPANEVVANYYLSDPPTIRLERGDRTATLWRVPPEGGARHEGQNVSLVQEGSRIAVEWLDTHTGSTGTLQCAAR